MTMPNATPTAARAIPSSRPVAETQFTAAWRARSPASASDAIWIPLASGVLILAAGAMSLATGQPWLFAALGPTALMMAHDPGRPATRFHAVVVGHVAGFLCGYLALVLLGGADSSSLLSGRAIPVVRVWASAFGVALTALVMPALRGWHPPAAATTLLVTLGVYRLTMRTSLGLLAGLLVVALLGEWLQRARLKEIRANQAA